MKRAAGSPPPSAPSRRAVALLAAGAAAGVLLAALGLGAGAGSGRGAELPPGAVARVNGTVIRGEEYERLLAAASSDRRDELDEARKTELLGRLVDEELLVQRGLELGLVQTDRKVRGDLVNSVIGAVVAEVEDAAPTDQQLRTFYVDNADYFARPGRMRVRQIFFRVAAGGDAAAAQTKAEEAVRRVRAGEDFVAVRNALGDAELAPLPDEPLPSVKLRDYVGITAARTAETLPPGEVSDAIRSGTGFHVLQVVEREMAAAPPFEDIRPTVQAEYRRRAGDRAVRAYLDELRASADVVVAPQR